MFLPASLPNNDDAPISLGEPNWFFRYLTFRTFLSLAAVLVATIWAFYTSDKNPEVDRLQKTSQQLGRKIVPKLGHHLHFLILIETTEI
jgi:hypothetical protein